MSANCHLSSGGTLSLSNGLILSGVIGVVGDGLRWPHEKSYETVDQEPQIAPLWAKLNVTN